MTLFLEELVFPVIHTFNLKLFAEVINVSEGYFYDPGIGATE